MAAKPMKRTTGFPRRIPELAFYDRTENYDPALLVSCGQSAEGSACFL
jgi:hypothetical protein